MVLSHRRMSHVHGLPDRIAAIRDIPLIDALTTGLATASANETERADEALEETEW